MSNNDDVVVSKGMTWILRHAAVDKGLDPDANGYIRVSEMLALNEFKNVTAETVARVVASNGKQRFCIEDRDGELYIRANQGHSGKVAERISDDSMMKDVDLVSTPVAYHGTGKDAYEIILREGLKKMGRKHVHLSKTYKKDNKANNISGIRGNAQVILEVDLVRATKEGIKFWESANGVILTEQTIPPHLFVRFE